jgi:hypothetical protein
MDNVMFSVLAAAAGAGAAGYWFLTMTRTAGGMFSMLSLGGVCLIAILNFGYLVAWFNATVGINKDFDLVLSAIGSSQSEYALAVTYATLFGAMVAFGALVPQIMRQEALLARKILCLDSQSPKFVIGITIGLGAITGFFLATGIIDYRSIASTGSSRLSILRPIADLVMAAAIPFTTYTLLSLCNKFKLSTFVIGASCAAINLFAVFNKGRSGLVLALILYFLYWFTFARAKPQLRFLLPVGVVLAIILPQVLAINNSMRNIRGTDSSAVEKAEAAFSAYTEDENLREAQQYKSANNLSSRPLVANILATCMSMNPNTTEHAFGIVFRNSLIWALPSALVRNKMSYIYQEGLLYRYFPNRAFLKDAADSLYLYAFVDFGWLGIVFYPLGLWLLWIIVLFFISQISTPIGAVLIFCLWPSMFIVSMGESGLTAWIIVARTTIMLALTIIAFERMFLPGLHSRRPKPLPVRTS